MEDEVEAVVYNIEITEGWMALTHDAHRMVRELFIPKSGIVVNTVDNVLHIFHDDAAIRRVDRGTNQEKIRIPAKFALDCELYVVSTRAMMNQADELIYGRPYS